jgi:glycosyltransferase involved in cell wall biosynthesis
MIDILYLAHNRLEYTRESFDALLRNTDWGQVSRLLVYDDGSQDGAREWLAQTLRESPPPVAWHLAQGKWGGPVAVTADYLAQPSGAPFFAKIDNDTMLPPGWLPACLKVMEAHPELDLLGIEAMDGLGLNFDPGMPRSYQAAEHIGGIGLFRRAAFQRGGPVSPGTGDQRWFGFTAWQDKNKVTCGWLKPALPVFLLDRVPHPPWSRYHRKYVEAGWQRDWPPYPSECDLWAWHWPRHLRATRAITIGGVPAARGETFTAPSSAVAIDLIARGLASPMGELDNPGPTGPVKIFGMMRVRNETRWIRDSVDSALAVCERVFVLDDHSGDGTAEICAAMGDRVTVIPSPFEGLDEARDKDFLLAQVVKGGPPDWVLALDGDEVLEAGSVPKILDAVRNWPGVSLLRFRIAYLWDSPDQARVDGVYGRFARPSCFRLRGQKVSRLVFRRKGPPGAPNFHCSSFPTGLIGRTVNTDVWIRHYGYMTREDRLRKYAWYRERDGNNMAEDRYRHIAQGDLPELPASARFRHAGPLTLAALQTLIGRR